MTIPGAAGAIPGAARPAPGGASAAVVYDDELRNGWAKYGWARVLDWADAARGRGGSGPAFRVQPGPFEAVYFHHPRFDTSPYDRLTLWLDGGDTGGQVLRVNLSTGNQTARGTGLTLPALKAGAWTPVTLDLKPFWAAGRKDLTGIWVQSMSDKPAPAFYVDDVRFLRAGESAPSAAAN